MGENVWSQDMAKRWFQQFKEWNFYLEVEPNSHRASVIGSEILKQLIQDDPRLSLCELTDWLKCCYSMVGNH